ncbi:MAG: ABC transporter permease [bacterium]
MKNKQKYIYPLIAWIVVLVIWEITVRIFAISPIILVPPSQIGPVIIDSFSVIYQQLSFTFYEVIIGWSLGTLVAFLVAVSCFSFKSLANLLTLAAVIVSAVPLIALAAILGGFLGTGQNTKTLLVAILCFFPMLIVSLSSFTRIERSYLNLFRTYQASWSQRFLKLILPQSLPALLNTMKINTVTALTTAIVSEFFGAHGGIGQFILSRKGFYDLPMVWAAIFYLIIATSIFYLIMNMLQKFYSHWH